ncbi:MAG: DUF4097 family beta strand repeat protein [Clostridia bacterium]|nr:DUF4097 family beta strand repeat protein [Clostridia bacterium]
MSKNTKKWLVVAVLLILLGTAVLAITGCSIDFDFTRLQSEKYTIKTYEVNDEFNSISIKADTANVSFIHSANEKCRVECSESKNVKYLVRAQNGQLTIEIIDTRKWYEHINFNFEEEKIAVYLPQKEYLSLVINASTGGVEIPNDFSFESVNVAVSTGAIKCYSSAKNIKINASTGSVCVENISTDLLEVNLSTGNVTMLNVNCNGLIKIDLSTGKTQLINVTCKSVSSSGSTGDISLNNVIALKNFYITRSTGDVYFEGCDAAQTYIKTDTGDVEGSFLSEKVFTVSTDTGKIQVPNSSSGGRCEIITDTGDIEINIKNAE